MYTIYCPHHIIFSLLWFSFNIFSFFSEGQTIHSAFDFKFGDEYRPLGDKSLDIVRTNLADLQLIIIDEMSMISSDMLYNIHQRLCELFQVKTIFANKAILLIGDLLQLRPPQGRFIFEQPRNSDYLALFNSSESLWNSFDAVNLTHNHRQGAGSQWADLLNRVRDGSYTRADIDLLKTRIIEDADIPELSEACHVMFTNLEGSDHNEKKLSKLQSKEWKSVADCSGPPGYEAPITAYGTIADTGLKKVLKIKEGARIVLIININTSDCLVNGSFGTILKIITKEHKVDHLIIKFDNILAGAKQRTDHPIHSSPYASENGTPLFRHNIPYNIPSSKGKKHQARANVVQIPVKLAWALTCHKMQVSCI